MNLPFTFRPIEAWPRPLTRNRQQSRFGASYPQTISDLQRELTAIKAKNIVLQVALRPEDLRRDGMPRANSKPAAHPGVILSFEIHPWNKPVESYSMPCDTFHSWEDNLRAIALSMEALRKINRYGVTQNNEQYRGWAALPPAPVDREQFATKEAAADFMAQFSMFSAYGIRTDAACRKSAYQFAARKLHPDAGGDPADFRKLQNAYSLLEKSS